MPPVDPRILRVAAARQQQQAIRAALAARSLGGQGSRARGVQVGPVGARRAVVQQQRAKQGAQRSAHDERARAVQESMNRLKATVKPAQHDGGGGGGGGGFGGLVSKLASAPGAILHALSYPKNLVQTGVLELEEALTESDKTPHWMRWLTAKPEQFNWFTPAEEVRAGRSNRELITGKPGIYKGKEKPPIGFGSMVQDLPAGPAIGPSWLKVHPGQLADRAIGFVGDVGMDPLTHITPAEKAVSAGERASLAQQALEKGLSPEVQEAAGKFGSRGVRRLGDEAAIEALGIKEPGLMLGGRQGVRIPGTGRLAETVAAPSRLARNLGRDTKLAAWTRKFGVSRSPELRDALESIVTGKEVGSVASPTVGLGHVAAATAGRKAGESRVLLDFANEVEDAAKAVRGDPEAMAAWERGTGLADPKIARLKNIGDQLRQRGLDEGASVGELGGDLNYALHEWLPEAKADLGKYQHNVRGVSLSPETHQFERAIKKGETYTFKDTPLRGTIRFKPKVGDAKEINEFWLKAFGHKAIQDDPAKVLARMAEGTASAVGKARYYNKAVEQGFLGSTEHGGRDILGNQFTKVVKDEEATKAAQALADEQAAGVLDQLRQVVGGEMPEGTLRNVEGSPVPDVMKRVPAPGMQELPTDRMIGRNLLGSDEFVRAMTGFKAAASEPPGGLAKAVDQYVRFFKNYATAKPGFHVRNAMSAVFMNLVAGVSPSEMRDGATIWQAYRKNPLGDWKGTLPDHLAAKADDVVDAVMMAGTGGQFSAAELAREAYGTGEGKITKRRRLWEAVNENKWTRGSRNVGERVEGVVRSGMALHGLNGPDGSLMKAANLIRKYHFDYSETNELDAKLRRFIPFWTFMSRNLPLQVEQMYRNPRMYSEFNNLMANVGSDEEGGVPLPEYLRDMGAVRLAGDWAFAPDVGPSQITSTLRQVQHPARFASNLTPPMKDLLALLTNQDFFYGQPYKEMDYQKPGIESYPFLPLLRALGKVQDTPQGPVVEQKYLDVIGDVIPSLADVNRFGATTQKRQNQGKLPPALSALGVPVRKAKPESELKRQAYEQRQGYYDRRTLLKALAEYGGPA